MTQVFEVDASRADDVVAVIHEAFAGRPVLDPPSTALDETVESVGKALAEHGGLLATYAGEPVGALLFSDEGSLLGLHRVGVLERARHHGVARLLADAAAVAAGERGKSGLVLEARQELPATIAFWQRNGYLEVDRDGPRLRMVRMLPLRRTLATAEDTRAIGERLGPVLRAGDLLILTGDLGAGKTTFTQGLGDGLAVRGPVTSPTFVIARVHPSLRNGPELVHVDAYRLGSGAELEDLDLDLARSVVVVEWGRGMAEDLADAWWDVELERPVGRADGLDASELDADAPRIVTIAREERR